MPYTWVNVKYQWQMIWWTQQKPQQKQQPHTIARDRWVFLLFHERLKSVVDFNIYTHLIWYCAFWKKKLKCPTYWWHRNDNRRYFTFGATNLRTTHWLQGSYSLDERTRNMHTLLGWNLLKSDHFEEEGDSRITLNSILRSQWVRMLIRLS